MHSSQQTDYDELDRGALIVAHEAVCNHLINDSSNMNRDMLKMAEEKLAAALRYEGDDHPCRC